MKNKNQNSDITTISLLLMFGIILILLYVIIFPNIKQSQEPIYYEKEIPTVNKQKRITKSINYSLVPFSFNNLYVCNR